MNKVPAARIGILGGSFDPIHNGHVTLGQAAVNEAKLDKLIVMPTHVSPFKVGRKYADDEHRIEMCRLAFSETAQAEVSSYEIEHTDISYTYDTLIHLRKLYPDDEIYFITGTDSFIEVEKWYEGIPLLKKFGFIVSARPGYRECELAEKIKEYKEKYGTKIIYLEHEMPDVSSTEIKAKRADNISIHGFVPESVERYIDEHKLYL